MKGALSEEDTERKTNEAGRSNILLFGWIWSPKEAPNCGIEQVGLWVVTALMLTLHKVS